MADRITLKQLQAQVAGLNRLCGYPEDGLEPGETFKSVDGAYVLDASYGGYRLCRYVGTGGGERDITPRAGARETLDMIRAYRAGFEAGRS